MVSAATKAQLPSQDEKNALRKQLLTRQSTLQYLLQRDEKRKKKLHAELEAIDERTPGYHLDLSQLQTMLRGPLMVLPESELLARPPAAEEVKVICEANVDNVEYNGHFETGTSMIMHASPLLSLPFEIRAMIWNKLFNATEIHFVAKQFDNSNMVRVNTAETQPQRTLALRSVCRQTYNETYDLPLLLGTWTFSNAIVMLDTLSECPLPQLSMIRHVRLFGSRNCLRDLHWPHDAISPADAFNLLPGLRPFQIEYEPEGSNISYKGNLLATTGPNALRYYAESHLNRELFPQLCRDSVWPHQCLGQDNVNQWTNLRITLRWYEDWENLMLQLKPQAVVISPDFLANLDVIAKGPRGVSSRLKARAHAILNFLGSFGRSHDPTIKTRNAHTVELTLASCDNSK